MDTEPSVEADVLVSLGRSLTNSCAAIRNRPKGECVCVRKVSCLKIQSRVYKI